MVVKWVGEAVLALNNELLLDVLAALMHFWIPCTILEVMDTLRQGPVEVVLLAVVVPVAE
jgi:hypothetical protein